MNKQFFTSRISRGGYFASIFGTLMLIQLFGAVASNVAFIEIFYPPIEVVMFFLLILFIVLSVKRLHDVNSSGFYVFLPLCFIVLVALIPLFGGFLAPMALVLSAIFLSVKKGTVGPNKYGEDPVYRKVPAAPLEK